MSTGEPAAQRAGASATDDASFATPLATLLDSLRDPAVRDLAWLLLSPDLLRPQPPVGALATPFGTPQEASACIAWLRALDAAPGPLHEELATTRITRLGRYAERLLGWFLQHGPAARLVAAGVPLRRAGVTLGECDFLVRTQQGVQLHWELAVKCYLHAGEVRALPVPRVSAPLSSAAASLSTGQLSEPLSAKLSARLSDYVGPNLKDRFDLKLAHVLNHQLPLSAREEFASVGYKGPWTPQMFIKGWLFYRHGETPPDPVELDPAHGRGWWVTRADWPAFAAAQNGKWRPLQRLEWLAPRRHTPADVQAGGLVFVDAPTLAAQTSHQHGPAMVAVFAEDGTGNLIECSRGFIVPDEWPAQAQEYARR
jgi:uncharacterized protein